jgi:hypothetical protein
LGIFYRVFGQYRGNGIPYIVVRIKQILKFLLKLIFLSPPEKKIKKACALYFLQYKAQAYCELYLIYFGG